jgi:hypothetical protein
MGAGSLRRASGCRTSTPTLHPRRGMATRSEPSRCEAPDGAVHRTARAALDLPFLRRVLPRKLSVPMSTDVSMMISTYTIPWLASPWLSRVDFLPVCAIYEGQHGRGCQMEAFESSQGGVAAREAKVGEIDRAARRRETAKSPVLAPLSLEAARVGVWRFLAEPHAGVAVVCCTGSLHFRCRR